MLCLLSLLPFVSVEAVHEAPEVLRVRKPKALVGKKAVDSELRSPRRLTRGLMLEEDQVHLDAWA